MCRPATITTVVIMAAANAIMVSITVVATMGATTAEGANYRGPRSVRRASGGSRSGPARCGLNGGMPQAVWITANLLMLPIGCSAIPSASADDLGRHPLQT